MSRYSGIDGWGCAVSLRRKGYEHIAEGGASELVLCAEFTAEFRFFHRHRLLHVILVAAIVA